MNLTSMLEPQNGETKWLALSCSHAPIQDNETIDIICERIKEYQPDVIIHLGDLFEADSASKWGSEYNWTYEDELDAGCNQVLKKLREANENAECWLLPGNHDENLRAEGRFDWKIRDSLDWEAPQYTTSGIHLNEELQHWKVKAKYKYNQKGTARIGATVFAHGYEAGGASDKFQAFSLGWPHGLFVSGHTHRPTPGEPVNAQLTQTRPTDRFYLNAGCTRTMECSYMERKYQQKWGHAVCYGYSQVVNSPRLKPTWNAYCELIKSYE